MGFNGYIPGDYKVECDRCGFEFRNSQLVTEWTGLRVCRQCWDFEPTYPTGPTDKISVPIPRPEQESTLYGNQNTTDNYGINLFPDPFISPLNDGLWSSGTTSQQHVYAEYFSKKLNNESSNISVSGLTVGQVYRLKASVWAYDTIRILIDGSNTGLFLESLPLEQWSEDSVYFTAIAENITFTVENTKTTDAWFDNIYIQAYTQVKTLLTPAEQIENKKPKTITVDLGAQPDIYEFFTLDEDGDFNSVGLDEGTMVDITE